VSAVNSFSSGQWLTRRDVLSLDDESAPLLLVPLLPFQLMKTSWRGASPPVELFFPRAPFFLQSLSFLISPFFDAIVSLLT